MDFRLTINQVPHASAALRNKWNDQLVEQYNHNAEKHEMIKLYRERNSSQADTIEAEFRDMVLGYDRVVVDEKEAAQLFGVEAELPVVTNNARVVSGDGIPAYIRELKQLMREWQLFQGDYCYVDDGGEVC